MNTEGTLESASEKFSARNGVLVQVDHDICVGFGDCVSTAPGVFALDDDNLAIVIDPNAADLTLLQAAADICPVSAIVLLDVDGNQVAP